MRTLPGSGFTEGLADGMSFHLQYQQYVAGMGWWLLVVSGDGAFVVPVSSAAPADRLAAFIAAVAEWTSLLPLMTAQIVPPLWRSSSSETRKYSGYHLDRNAPLFEFLFKSPN